MKQFVLAVMSMFLLSTYAAAIEKPSSVISVQMEDGKIGVWCQDSDSGAFIYDLAPGGPADRAGIRIGDTIVSVDGQQITRSDDLWAYLNKTGVPTRMLMVEIQKGRGPKKTSAGPKATSGPTLTPSYGSAVHSQENQYRFKQIDIVLVYGRFWQGDSEALHSAQRYMSRYIDKYVKPKLTAAGFEVTFIEKNTSGFEVTFVEKNDKWVQPVDHGALFIDYSESQGTQYTIGRGTNIVVTFRLMDPTMRDPVWSRTLSASTSSTVTVSAKYGLSDSARDNLDYAFESLDLGLERFFLK